MARVNWRDLSCLPWCAWIVRAALQQVEKAPNAIDGPISLLLIAVSVAPGFLLVWSYRETRFVRREWWIPLLYIAARTATAFES